MKKETIYLVMACTMYESSTPIKAFDRKVDADAFAARCEAHHAKMPKSPEDPPEDTPENDALYEEYFAKKERWSKRHPAGNDNSYCDDFMVTPIIKVSNVKVRGAEPAVSAERPF